MAISARQAPRTATCLALHASTAFIFAGSSYAAEPDKAVVRRATNRRMYDGRPVDDPTFAWLREATPPLDRT